MAIKVSSTKRRYTPHDTSLPERHVLANAERIAETADMLAALRSVQLAWEEAAVLFWRYALGRDWPAIEEAAHLSRAAALTARRSLIAQVAAVLGYVGEPSPDPNDLLTRSEAAAILGVHPNTVRKLQYQGRLAPAAPGYRGQETRYRRADVERLKAELLPADDLVSGPEAARLLGVHPATVGRYRRAGRLVPAGRGLHGEPLYRRADVEALAAEIRRQRGEGDPDSTDEPRLAEEAAA